MHHRPTAFDMEQRLRPQPDQQLVAVGGAKHFFERVFLAGLAIAFRLHHQMQIMIAEHHRGRRAERLDEAQHLE